MYWVGIAERGTITVSARIAPCRIGYYEVEVKPERHYLPGRRHYVFAGRTADGRVLGDAEFVVKEEIGARTAEYRRRVLSRERS